MSARGIPLTGLIIVLLIMLVPLNRFDTAFVNIATGYGKNGSAMSIAGSEPIITGSPLNFTTLKKGELQNVTLSDASIAGGGDPFAALADLYNWAQSFWSVIDDYSQLIYRSFTILGTFVGINISGDLSNMFYGTILLAFIIGVVYIISGRKP